MRIYPRTLRKILVTILLSTFLINGVVISPSGYAQTENFLNPTQPVSLSASTTPALIKGLKVFPQTPFKLDFIVDRGESGLKGESLQSESTKIVKYFLEALTVPEKDLWVNL